jgi:hypothetical protein
MSVTCSPSLLHGHRRTCRMLLMRETASRESSTSSIPPLSTLKPQRHGSPSTTRLRLCSGLHCKSFSVSLEFPRFLAFLAVLNVPSTFDCMFQSTLVSICIVQDGSASAPPKFFAPAGAHLGQAAPVCIESLVEVLQKFLPLTLSFPIPLAHRRQRSPRCPSPNSSKR